MFAYYYQNEIAGCYSLVFNESKACEFCNLCVLPKYRHRNIGRQLVNDAVQRAKAFGCVKIRIGIVEENTVLKNWYKKLGFRHTGTEKFEFFPFTCGYMEKIV